jgi:SulP family sulfate permease
VVLTASFSAGYFHLDEQGVALVGPLAQGFPTPKFTLPTIDELRRLAGPAALIALIGYLESVSIAQILARRNRERIVANRELIGLGLANLAVGIMQGMPVAGSISRSAESDMAGARTRAAGVFASTLVVLVPLLLSGLLAQLPRAVLAAIIISAVLRLLDWHALARTWRYDRADGFAWAATMVGVLVIGVEAGLMAGLALSLLLYVWRTANPHLTEVGRLPYSDTFVDLKRHHEAETWPQIALIRIDESLFFGNASAVETYMLERVADRGEVTDLILIASAVNSVDSSALAMLEDLEETLSRNGMRLHLAEVKGPVLDRLAGTTLLQRLGHGRLHVSAAAAVVSLASPPI